MMSDETSDSSLLNGYDLTPEESSAVFCSVKRHCKSKNPSRWQRRRRKTEAIKILKGWQDKGVLPKQSYLNLSDQLEASNVASAEFFKRIGFEKLVEAIEQRDLAVGTSGSKDEQAEKINEEHDVQETVPSSSAFERSYTDGQCHLDDLAREYAAAAAAVSGENNNRGSEYFYVRQPRRIFTFREILAHWGSAHSTHAALTELLKVLHELQITLGPKDYCGRKWPLTGHTLLQFSREEKSKVLIRDLAEYDPDENKFVKGGQFMELTELVTAIDEGEVLVGDDDNEELIVEETTDSTWHEIGQDRNFINLADALQMSQVSGGVALCSESIKETIAYEADAESESSDGDDDCNALESSSDDDEVVIKQRKHLPEDALAPDEMLIDLEEEEDLDHKLAYLGIQNALMGQSCGLLDKTGYVRNMKVLAEQHLEDLSDKLLDSLDPKEAIRRRDLGTESIRGTCPTFVIDLFIDGVEIFKNSASRSATPILGRVIAVDGHLIPSKRSKPFVIAVFHGAGKPNLDAFTWDLIRELNYLNPMNNVAVSDRDVKVIVRALVCDAVGRFWIKGTTSNSGYFSCERCNVRGELQRDPETKKILPGTMKFIATGEEKLRVDSDWESYKTVPDGIDYDASGKPIKRYHRKKTGTPLERIAQFRLINSIPLEEMHLCDGGATETTLRTIFGIHKAAGKKANKRMGKKRGRPKKNTTKKLRKAPAVKKRRVGSNMSQIDTGSTSNPETSEINEDHYSSDIQHRDDPDYVPASTNVVRNQEMEIGLTELDNEPSGSDKARWKSLILQWRKFTPNIFSRHCRPFGVMHFWKMAETRQFLFYFAIPLILMAQSFPAGRFRDLLHYIRGYLLLTGNTHEPVDEATREEANYHLSTFVTNMSKRFPSWATYKCHALLHLARETFIFQCHLGSLSGYPYENVVKIFRELGTRSRKHVVPQIVNRLLELKQHHLPTKTNGWEIDCEDSGFKEYSEQVKANGGNLDLPPFFVKRFDSVKSTVECEAFTISLNYPENLVRLPLHKSPTDKQEACFGAIQKIYEHDVTGDLMIDCGIFEHVELSFKDPYPSSEINNFKIVGGHSPTFTSTYKFSDIEGTVFPFHMRQRAKAKATGRRKLCIDTSDKDQSWIFQQIHL